MFVIAVSVSRDYSCNVSRDCNCNCVIAYIIMLSPPRSKVEQVNRSINCCVTGRESLTPKVLQLRVWEACKLVHVSKL